MSNPFLPNEPDYKNLDTERRYNLWFKVADTGTYSAGRHVDRDRGLFLYQSKYVYIPWTDHLHQHQDQAFGWCTWL
jgi:hypothetical protein